MTLDDTSSDRKDINFEIQLAFSLQQDSPEYFLKLLSSDIFSEVSIEEKIAATICALSLNKPLRTKYLHHLIISSGISIEQLKFVYGNYSNYLENESSFINGLFTLKELNSELPINIKEEKKTKV